MKWIHPILSRATAALFVIFSVCGCSAQSGGVGNPFLAPNRVPPPATRTLAPGQAQPYYPGDPLPVMQSRVTTGQQPTLVAQSMPSADPHLSWAPPGNAPLTSEMNVESNPAAVVGQRVVAIPSDDRDLRFALPEGPPAAAVATQAPTSSPHPAVAIPTVDSAPPQSNGIVQASYQPAPAVPQTAGAPAQVAMHATPASPWRAPTIDGGAPSTESMPSLPPPPNVPPLALPQASPRLVASARPPEHSMRVQLRAMASPEPTLSTTPRIRLPGAAAIQTASSDGFRPRSSMR